MEKLRSPKAKFSVELRFSKSLAGIGSADSFSSDQEVNESHPYIKRSKQMADRAGASLIVIVRENKACFPKFNWVEVKKFKA